MGQTIKPSTTETLLLDDDVWDELIALTNGAAGLCFQCGVCTAVCPWGLVKDETISIRSIIRGAQLGLQKDHPNLWLCTMCGGCEVYCPRGVSIRQIQRALRFLSWEERQTPVGLPSLLWSVFWNHNPWTQPPSHRTLWEGSLDLPRFDPALHEILLYVGCTPSYDRRAQKVTLALVHILQAAGVSFGILGDNEPCCGEAVLSVGHLAYFQEVSEKASAVFINQGVEQMVTISPHCYDVFKNHYEPWGENVEIYHYTQYLAELKDQRRLSFVQPFPMKATIHDPCYLARHNHDAGSVRELLATIPDLVIQEMPHSGVNTLCCGGGGGRMWLETAPDERFADVRVQEALATGAEILVTACPFCIACLEDSIKAKQIKDLMVLDVAELAAQAVAFQT